MEPPPIHEVPSRCWNDHVGNNRDRLVMLLLWTNSPKTRGRKEGLKRCGKALVGQFWEKWSHHWEGKSFLLEFFLKKKTNVLSYCLRQLHGWGSHVGGQVDIAHYFAKDWVLQCGCYQMVQAGCARHWGQWGVRLPKIWAYSKSAMEISLYSACMNSIKEIQPEFKINSF